MGPALFFLPLRSVLTRVREEYESQGVEAYAYLDDITIAADEISPGMVGVVPFLERVDSEGHTRQPGQDGCLGPEGTRTHAGRDITFGRSGCPHRGRRRDKGFPVSLYSGRYWRNVDARKPSRASWNGGGVFVLGRGVHGGTAHTAIPPTCAG